MLDFTGAPQLVALHRWRGLEPDRLAQGVFLEAGLPGLLEHSRRVVALASDLAAGHGEDPGRCAQAGWLHDLGRIFPSSEALMLFRRNRLPLCPLEAARPDLLHPRLSALVAEDLLGVTDPAVLRAIACHATLRRDPSPCDLILFLADKLSWSRSPENAFHEAVLARAATDLAEACAIFFSSMDAQGRYQDRHPDLIEAQAWLTSQRRQA